MTKDIFCKSLANRWKTGRLSFSRSSSAKARRVSAKAISRRCSRPSSANRRQEAICKGGGSTMPYYQRLGEIPRKHHIWLHRKGATPTYKNEGTATEDVLC